MCNYTTNLLFDAHAGSINEANADLKNNLRNVFPNVPKKMLDSVIPERAGISDETCPVYVHNIILMLLIIDHTTGKLYGALVIQYHWRSNKISQRKLELYKLHRRMSMLVSYSFYVVIVSFS